MKCIALATRFGQEKINSYVQSQLLSFFEPSLKANLEQQIIQFCDRVQSGNSFHTKHGANHIYMQKLDEDCCAISCDTELSDKQLRYLMFNMLVRKIPLKEIASNLENYTQDFKTQEIKAELVELFEIMRQNLEKVRARGGKIEELAKQTQELEENSRIFKRTVDENTSSCWPCNLF